MLACVDTAAAAAAIWSGVVGGVKVSVAAAVGDVLAGLEAALAFLAVGCFVEVMAPAAHFEADCCPEAPTPLRLRGWYLYPGWSFLCLSLNLSASCWKGSFSSSFNILPINYDTTILVMFVDSFLAPWP